MRIVPAVDIRGGLCVNLVQGDYDQETVFSGNPAAQAKRWHALGAELVHIVDLDGAKAGRLINADALAAMRDAGVPYEIGGGIRSVASIEYALELGASRVILGTAAAKRPELVEEASAKFPGVVVVGIDASAGRVATDGWLEVTSISAVELAKRMEDAGAVRIIYTDIQKDGMMEGPGLESTRALAEAVSIPVTASGGMASLEDVKCIGELAGAGVDEVIIGRALYLGAFTLEEAIEAAAELA